MAGRRGGGHRSPGQARRAAVEGQADQDCSGPQRRVFAAAIRADQTRHHLVEPDGPAVVGDGQGRRRQRGTVQVVRGQRRGRSASRAERGGGQGPQGPDQHRGHQRRPEHRAKPAATQLDVRGSDSLGVAGLDQDREPADTAGHAQRTLDLRRRARREVPHRRDAGQQRHATGGTRRRAHVRPSLTHPVPDRLRSGHRQRATPSRRFPARPSGSRPR